VDITPLVEKVRPLEVEPNEFRSFEAAIKKFRKLVDKDGKLRLVRERARGYVKPSKKKHNKRRYAKHIRKRIKEEERLNRSRRGRK
jgi:ribosomal protein S21